MSNTVQGVPTPADWPVTAGNATTRVTKNADGTIAFPAGTKGTPLGQSSFLPGNITRYDWDAMLSAHVMIDVHDQRILDAGQIPDLDYYRRINLWYSYFNVSRQQFAADDANFQIGREPQQIYAADGVPTYSPDRIAGRVIAKALKEESDREDQVVEELLAHGYTARQLIDISRTLPLDPVHRRIVDAQIDLIYPPETIVPDLTTLPKTPTVTNVAPLPALGPLNTAITSDPSLPPSATNILTQSQIYEWAARQASEIVSDAPEYYRAPTAAEAEQAAKVRDFFYWKSNYPRVELVPAQNPGLRADELTTPWPGPGLAPLVLVQITPQQRPLPEKGWLAQNPWLGLIVSVIPLVGGIIGAGLSYTTNQKLKTWAGQWKPNADAFAPQFYPKPFQVPMPLDRAQIMVREPWYAPAMVDEFAAEVRNNQLIFASQAYADLVAAMNSQTRLTTAGALPNSQGAATKDSINLPSAAAGSALAFLIAAGLLVAGAPVAVPVAVVILFAQKK